MNEFDHQKRGARLRYLLSCALAILGIYLMYAFMQFGALFTLLLVVNLLTDWAPWNASIVVSLIWALVSTGSAIWESRGNITRMFEDES